jgi:S-layer homology domain
VVVINFISSSAVPPFYTRTVDGYIHSTSTSGSYAPYKFYGNFYGAMFAQGGNVTLSTVVQGRLYSGGGALSGTVNGSRSLPPMREVTLSITDTIAQFQRADFQAGSTDGRIEPGATFTGHANGTISGTFTLDHNSLHVGGDRQNTPGWLVGNLRIASDNGGFVSGIMLADLPNVSAHGYFFQISGSGLYANSLFFGSFQGAIGYNGGTDIAIGLGGTFCDSFQVVTPTATPTEAASQTPTPVVTVPPTGTPTALATASSTTAPSNTAIPTFTPTPTPCAITFTDVQSSDYFYQAVRYLYCHGIVSGYGDGTFKPYNLTTRGQLTKIVTLAEGWTLYTPPTPTFRDVPASHAFYAYIETSYSHGIISGYNCGAGCLEFRPGNNITRGQVCKVVALAQAWPIYTPPSPSFSDVPATDPFYRYIETAYYRGIVAGYGCGTGCLEFRPGNNATRGQICKIVYLAITAP